MGTLTTMRTFITLALLGVASAVRLNDDAAVAEAKPERPAKEDFDGDFDGDFDLDELERQFGGKGEEGERKERPEGEEGEEKERKERPSGDDEEGQGERKGKKGGKKE